jgi:hypothetical protein
MLEPIVKGKFDKGEGEKKTLQVTCLLLADLNLFGTKETGDLFPAIYDHYGNLLVSSSPPLFCCSKNGRVRLIHSSQKQPKPNETKQNKTKQS